MKKIRYFIAGAGIVACGILVSLSISKSNNVKADQKTDKDFVQIAMEGTAKPLTIDVITSSNPWDYVDEEYYNSIVEMGTDAIEPLTELLKSGKISGPYMYVSAVALEEITGCHMQDVTGVEWSNVDQFLQMWDSTMMSLTDTLESIRNDERMSNDDKIYETEKYGVFGKAYAEKISTDMVDIGDSSIAVEDDENLKEKYETLAETISENDIENAINYITSDIF